MRKWTMLCVLTLAGMVCNAWAAEPSPGGQVAEKVDWPAFMARQDIVWETFPNRSPNFHFYQMWKVLPTQADDGPFLGNGLMGTMIYRHPENAKQICFVMGRSDVTDRRSIDSRIYIGSLDLTTVGTIQRGTMRLDLWNAEARGSVVTDQGTLELRALVHANKMVALIEIHATGAERNASFRWNPGDGQIPAFFLIEKKRVPKSYVKNPPGSGTTREGVEVFTQPHLVGGEFATAWRAVDIPGGKRVVLSIANSFSGTTAHQEAFDTVQATCREESATLVESHRQWWHAYYPKSFVSVPDARLESFYWIQLYKLASASRPDGGPMDVAGPWFDNRPDSWYASIWWDLNIQSAYQPVYTANHLEQGESFIRLIDEYKDQFFKQAKKHYRSDDGASVAATTGHDLSIAAGLYGSPGHLPYALYNYYLHYRHSMDHSLITDQTRHAFYPLLRANANLMMQYCQKANDGKWHLEKTHSPEYGDDTDTNYNLALMRWELQTLLDLNDRYQLNDPLQPKWREVLSNLAEYPTDANGFRIGATKPAGAHRHWSHLFMIHPLHNFDLDDAANRELATRSLEHWIKITSKARGWDRLLGWSHSAAASLYAALGDGDQALAHLHQHINDPQILPNTMCLDPFPVIDAAMILDRSLQDMLLQSHGNLIRVFPAIPSAWQDTVMHDFLAEGAFLISAQRKGGQTQWVRVKSLAGEPCRIAPGLQGTVQCTAPFKPLGNGRYELTLAKGEEALLYVGDKPQPVIQALAADPGQANPWGVKTPVRDQGQRNNK